MAVKEWFRRLQPLQLYLVLFFTVAFFIVEIVASHITHSLTLLSNAYHMLCNIVALIGYIASVKYGHKDNYRRCTSSSESSIRIKEDENGSNVSVQDKAKQSCSDRRMKNTFGWARIDILTMLVCCVLLASFCFSLMVEALQTLIHIDHLDEMHHPLPVMCIGISGILLNGFCYVVIGGYIFNQRVFLHVAKDGSVVMQRTVRSEVAVEGELQLSPGLSQRDPLTLQRRQSFREILRDVFGCFLVVIASIIVYFTDAQLAKFIDPVFAIISAILLLVLSYPYMRESGLILLQTIPNHINIVSLKKELLVAFPGIVSVHDLHVWHLAGAKVICTAHIIFLDPMVYATITDDVTGFFVEMGITQVTIQPEFHQIQSNSEQSPCLIRCHGKRCKTSQCCSKEVTNEEPQSELRRRESTHSVTEERSSGIRHTDCSVKHRKSCPESSTFAIDVEIVESHVRNTCVDNEEISTKEEIVKG